MYFRENPGYCRMNRETFLDKGERVFVGAVAFVLAAEVLCTIVGTGTQFAWPRLVLGVFGSVFILFLAQRLYGGDRAIEKIALAWAGFQIVLTVAGLVVGPPRDQNSPNFLQELAVPWRGLAALKLVAYLTFATGLVMRSSPRAFLAAKRGDHVDHFLPPTVVDDSSPITWTADQAKVFGSLAGWMQTAAIVLILVGIYLILNAIPPSLLISTRKALALLEGFLTLGLGVLLFAPALALGGSGDAAVNSTGRLEAALQRLTLWHLAAIVVGLGLAATAVLRFVLLWSA
jgi:hypothetical protein